MAASGSTSGAGYSDRQVQLIAVCTVCLVLSTIAVGLRLLVRRFGSVANSWWDDWITVLALIASWEVNIATLVGIPYGLGKHNHEVDKSKATSFGITVYIQQLGWTISIALTIISILLFYLRIFPNRWIRLTIQGIGLLTITWVVAVALVVVFQCKPISFFWNHEIEGGKCIRADHFYFSAGITSTVAIIFVLFLPLPIILRLKATTAKKVGLASSFMLGAFVGIASIVRLVTLFYIKREDLTYTSSLPQLWSCVEVSFGVIAACVPSLTPLFLLIFNKAPSRLRKPPYSYESNKQTRHKTAKNSFNRLGIGIDPHTGSHSQELIMMKEQKENTDVSTMGMDSTEGIGVAIMESNIVVTSQVDQVSKGRVGDGSPEAFGVQAHARAWTP